MDPNSPQFKSLKAKWYKKLEASGFDDIEKGESIPRRRFAVRSQFPMERHALMGLTADYFTRAQRLLDRRDWYSKAMKKVLPFRKTGSFKRPPKFEYRVWKLHSEGVSTLEIANQLGCGYDRAERIIDVLAAEIGVK